MLPLSESPLVLGNSKLYFHWIFVPSGPQPTPHIWTHTLSTGDTAPPLGHPTLSCYPVCATSNLETSLDIGVDTMDTFCFRGGRLTMAAALSSCLLFQLFTSEIIFKLMSYLFVSSCLTLVMRPWLKHWINIWISWHVDKSSFSSSAPFAMKTDLS